jgi:hypothetical protein
MRDGSKEESARRTEAAISKGGGIVEESEPEVIFLSHISSAGLFASLSFARRLFLAFPSSSFFPFSMSFLIG